MALFTKPAKRFHYMGEGFPAGDTLRMIVMAESEWIGWTDQQRAARKDHCARVLVQLDV